MSVRLYVGVVGPGDASAEQLAQAEEVGRLLAERGMVVVTGGLGGVMAAAARGCARAGGTSLGLLPGHDRADGDPHLTLSLPTGMGEMRNALLVRSCDALVAVGTSWGTLSEVALAARTGVPVVEVDGPLLLAQVPGGAGVVPPVSAASPSEAVDRVAALLDRPGPGEPHVLGVDRASGRWLGALLPVSGSGQVRLLRAPGIRALVEEARAVARVEVVGIDIPIGLPDTGPRQADVLTRRRLGPRASSVFPTPVRDALLAPTVEAARRVSIDRTGGRSLAAQSYALRSAILDVDEFVRSDPGVRVVEVHPELSFATLAGAPMAHRKKDRAGATERRDLLRLHGVELPEGTGVDTRGIDDILDASVVAWTAARVARGAAERVPQQPQRFSDGLDAAIWC